MCGCSRYKLYYADEQLRRVAVKPMLLRVVQQFTRAARGLLGAAASEAGAEGEGEAAPPDRSPRPSVSVFSGHDVNLLGLLVALNASEVQGCRSHWPDYGASLVFELVHSQGGVQRPGGGHEEEEEGEDLVVNVYYNQQPLSFQLLPGEAAGGEAVQGGGEGHSILLADLIAFCDKL